MGTNYYANINCCKHCGRPEEKIHIGKSSFGWKFLIDMNDSEYYKSFEEFISFISNKDIRLISENNDEISWEDLLGLIKSKKDGKDHCEEYPEDKFADCNEASLLKGGFS